MPQPLQMNPHASQNHVTFLRILAYQPLSQLVTMPLPPLRVMTIDHHAYQQFLPKFLSFFSQKIIISTFKKEN